jgi:hypothetical protein
MPSLDWPATVLSIPERSLMPRAVQPFVSMPGAPLEPQRSPIRLGVGMTRADALIQSATSLTLLAQEALEPTFVAIETHALVGGLVASTFDVVLTDLATFVGERTLGWDGLAIAAFGPWPTDGAVSVAVVAAATWAQRRDVCERFVRASVRSVAWVRTEGALARGEPIGPDDVEDWWPDLHPSARELSAVGRWRAGPTPRALREGLAWTSAG